MSIHKIEIGYLQPSLDKVTHSSDVKRPYAAVGNTTEVRSASKSEDRTSLNVFRRLQDRLSAAAKSIRMTDDTLRAVDERLKTMQELLDRIIKNYPPYPPGDPERIRILRSYSALRKEIDQLIIPPAEDNTGKTNLPKKAVLEGKGWELGLGEKTVSYKNMPHFENMAVGIPHLSETADDQEIISAAAGVKSAKKYFNDQQADFASKAAKFVESGEVKQIFPPQLRNRWLPNEAEAVNSSYEVRRVLSDLPTGIANDSADIFVI